MKSRTGSGTAPAFADHLHRQRGRPQERVEGKHGENGVERLGGRRAAGVDQPPGDARRGKVGVDDRELVAVSHRRQRMQEIGVQQRMDALEHPSP